MLFSAETVKIRGCDVSEEYSVWHTSLCPQTLRSIDHTEKQKNYLRGLIPQSLQLQVQETLSSLGWCHKLGECVNSCTRRSVCSCTQSGGGASAAIMWQRYEGRKVFDTCAEGYHARWWGLCERNPAIHRYFSDLHNIKFRNLRLKIFLKK